MIVIGRPGRWRTIAATAGLAGLVSLCALLAVSYSPLFTVAVVSTPSTGPQLVVEGRHPATSPDGRTLAYDTQDGLWVRRDGDDWRVVPASGGIIMEPSVSPDGRELAYVRHEVQYEGVYVSDLETDEETLVAAPIGPFIYMHPAWSPDGTELCLTRMGPSSDVAHPGEVEFSIWIGTMGKPGLEYVTAGADAAWSPDGTSLVVQRPARRIRIPRVDSPESDADYMDLMVYDLWLVDRASHTARFLTSGAEPTWSPSGRHVAFTDYRVITEPSTRVLRELWVVDVATGTRHRLTDALEPLDPASAAQAVPVAAVGEYRGIPDFGLHADYEPAWSSHPYGLYFAAYQRGSGVFYIYFSPFTR